VKKGEQQGETSFGQFAHLVYTKGNTENVSLAARTLDSDNGFWGLQACYR
jgi:hypothetical protein